jgi:hypothetical protein
MSKQSKKQPKNSKIAIQQQQIVSCKGAKTQNWYAWLNTMPPKPDDFHVTGEVRVGNPGIYVLLVKKQFQVFGPLILLLDLHLVQRPGLWPQVISWVPARYDETNAVNAYTKVRIFCGQKIIAKKRVVIVS